MTQYVTLDTYKLPLETLNKLSLHDNNSKITQGDYNNALMQIRVSKDVRMALNRVQVAGGEHKLDTWTVTGKGVYVGSWSKRLAKWIYKTDHIRLEPGVLSVISERVARTLTGTTEELQFLFSKTPWDAGSFGEKTDSCWFPGRSYYYCQQGLLESEGGGAVKIFSANGGRRARCWYYNLEGSLLVFNAYDKLGKLDILSIARLLSVHYGMNYHRHEFVTIDEAYINGKSIYAIGNPPIDRAITLDFALRQKKSVPTLHDEPALAIRNNNACLNCGADRYEQVTLPDGKKGCKNCIRNCHHCDAPHIMADIIMIWDGDIVCQSCAEEFYELCGECDNYIPKEWDECQVCNNDNTFYCVHCEEDCEGDYVTLPSGSRVCDSCYSDYYHTCEECRDVVHDEDSYWIESQQITVCNHCYSDRYGCCDVCGDYYHGENLTVVRNFTYCEGCAESRLVNCDRCGDSEHQDYSYCITVNDDGDEEQWCESCYNAHATTCPICGERYYAETCNHMEIHHETQEPD